MPQPHVLLLEDDAPLLSVLCELFVDENIDVTVCTSLAEIYAGLQHDPTAVVVTDSWAKTRAVDLGAQDREELLALDAVASVVLTTGRRWSDSSLHRALGNIRVLEKPYDLDELVRAVRAGVRERELVRAGG
jgi:DNA-binding response OmpR family regulator